MKNKYSPANIKLYRECQCPKCTPELYGLNNPNLSIPSGNMKESFITAENFQSFEKSNIYEEEVSSGEENEGILGDIKKEIEDLRLIRKIILMVELTGIDCQISYKDKILKNLDDVIK